MQIPSGQFFLEIFAGAAGLSQAISARGMQFLAPIELEPNHFVLESVDFLDPLVFQHVELLIDRGVIKFIHFGTPCSSFSIARKKDGGPPPLRDAANLWGLPQLSPKDQAKLLQGNEFMRLTAQLARRCYARRVGWSIENPASSFLWSMPPMVTLQKLPQVRLFLLDMCRFGSPHKKPTAVLSTIDLSALAQQCDMVVRPHFHEPLTGTVLVHGRRVFRTRLAQVYPPALCEQWAKIIVAQHADPLEATFQLTTPSADRKRPLGQPVPWKVHKQRVTAEKAVAAGYQLKRSALPPLLPHEVEPGEAVRIMLELQHPFTTDPALEPDLQEALAMSVHKPAFLLGHRHGAVHFWEARAHQLLPATDDILRQIPDRHLRFLLRGCSDDQPLQLGSCTHVALWRELLSEANCVDRQLLSDLVQGFQIIGPRQRSLRWGRLQSQEDFIPEEALRARAWEFSQKVVRNIQKGEVTENTAKIWESTMEDVAEGTSVGPFFVKEEVDKFLHTSDWIPTQRFEVVQKNKGQRSGQCHGQWDQPGDRYHGED